jgi:hypothetical protein
MIRGRAYQVALVWFGQRTGNGREKVNQSPWYVHHSSLSSRNQLAPVGITPTETFARRVNTHLLCPSRSGLKYNKALQWQVAVVDMEWIYGIGKEGKIPDADLDSAKQKLGQVGSKIEGTTTDGTRALPSIKTDAERLVGPNRLEATDLLPLGNNISLFGPSNGLLPTQRQLTEPTLGAFGPGSTEIEGGNGLLGVKQGGSASSMSEARPEQSSDGGQNSQIDRERKREAQRNQLATSLDALLKHQREESIYSDQPRKRARPNIRQKVRISTQAGTGSIFISLHKGYGWNRWNKHR